MKFSVTLKETVVENGQKYFFTAIFKYVIKYVNVCVTILTIYLAHVVHTKIILYDNEGGLNRKNGETTIFAFGRKS